MTASLANTALNTGDALGDVYSGIENLTGSNNADTLYGDGSANAIDGGRGNDALIGGAGADTLKGGLGTDTADYSASSLAVTVYLDGTVGVGGDAAGDTLSGIENLLGSVNADTLYGDGNANAIDGGSGNDTLVGGAGADTLIGGLGTDTASYSNGGTGVMASLANSALNTGDAAGDVYSGIENLTGSGFADTLYGDGNANAIDGGAGDDTLIGGAGADSLTGGLGSDTASYITAGAGLTASLANKALNTGDAAGDVYSGIENLTGSNFDDTLYGNSSNNVLDGGSGNDLLVGGAGADTLVGGAGSDRFRFDVAPTKTSRDAVIDFQHGVDTIELSRTAFGAFAAVAAGQLDPAQLAIGPVATTAGQHLIYDPSTAILSYDADGAGGQAAIAIAQFTAHPLLTAADIYLL